MFLFRQGWAAVGLDSRVYGLCNGKSYTMQAVDRDRDVGFDTTVCFYLDRGGLLLVWTVGFTGCVICYCLCDVAVLIPLFVLFRQGCDVGF